MPKPKLTLRDARQFAITRISLRGGQFEPFLLGWYHGIETKLYASPEAVANFVEGEKKASRFNADLRPDWIDIYLNGRDDGVKGDRTRVAMMKQDADDAKP
jgi:hypothetical protein